MSSLHECASAELSAVRSGDKENRWRQRRRITHRDASPKQCFSDPKVDLDQVFGSYLSCFFTKMKPRLKRIMRSSVRQRLTPLRGPRALRVRKAPLRGTRGSLRGPKPRPKSVLGQKKKRKLKVPTTPQNRRRPPSSCLKLFQEAVLTVREAKEGVSLSKILRLLQVKYRGPLIRKKITS